MSETRLVNCKVRVCLECKQLRTVYRRAGDDRQLCQLCAARDWPEAFVCKRCGGPGVPAKRIHVGAPNAGLCAACKPTVEKWRSGFEGLPLPAAGVGPTSAPPWFAGEGRGVGGAGGGSRAW
jgi:ribosomal protein L40E